MGGTKTKKKGYFFESKSRGSKKLANIHCLSFPLSLPLNTFLLCPCPLPVLSVLDCIAIMVCGRLVIAMLRSTLPIAFVLCVSLIYISFHTFCDFHSLDFCIFSCFPILSTMMLYFFNALAADCAPSAFILL